MTTSDGRSTPYAPARDSGSGGTALLIIDMINDFAFEGADAIRDKAAAAARAIAPLRRSARERDVPVIYVNDHFGEWHSERSRLVERARGGGGEIVAALEPADDEYFVIKPQFSGFYATNLPVLLPKLGISRLVITGMSAEVCVLFTAADAHMRDYRLWVPANAVAAADDSRKAAALAIMRDTMGAETTDMDSIMPALEGEGR